MAHPFSHHVGGNALLFPQILRLPDDGPGLLLQPRLQWDGIVHVFLFGVEEEPAGVAEGAVIAGASGVGKEQPVPRPGKGHIAKPPLLLQLLPGICPLSRENALGQAAEEHHREFQALGGVDGHELHRLSLFAGVHIGEQGGVVQIVAQSHGLPCLAGEVKNGLLQFRQIVQPLLLSGGAKHGLIAAVVEHPGQQVRQIHIVEDGPVFFNEPGIVLCSASAEGLRFQIGKQGVIQRAAFCGGIGFQGGNAGTAHPPPGLVDGAQETDVVRVVDHAQIAEHILDLFPFVEFHAGIQNVGNFVFDQGLLQGPGYIVGPVQHPHVGIGNPLLRLVQRPHIGGDPVRLQSAGFGVKIQGLPVVAPDGGKPLFQPLPVLFDQGVGGRQDLGRGTVVFV